MSQLQSQRQLHCEHNSRRVHKLPYHYVCMSQASRNQLLISLLNFWISHLYSHVSAHSRHMCQLSWLNHKEKHRNMNHSGRRVCEDENDTALTFLLLNYADGTSARYPLCESFPWQSGSNMLIMMDVDQGPTGADDIQISNHIQRSPHPHCCKLILYSGDATKICVNCIWPACVL